MPQPQSLTFRRQPLKAIYMAYSFGSLLVKTPLWALRFLIPALRPRSTWPISRSLLIWRLQLLVRMVFNTASFGLVRIDPRSVGKDADKYGLVWIDATPELVVGEIKEAAESNGVSAVQVAGYWYGKRDENGQVGQRARPDEKVILQLHCGGWVIGDANPVGACAVICHNMLECFPQFTRLFSPEYRLSQGPPLTIENPFPAALIDTVAAYNYLVNGLGFKPANILVSGDSAGANLALALARYIAVAGLPSLPSPGGLFLMSPSGDWGTSHGGPGTSMERNGSSDWVQSFVKGYCSYALLGHLPESDLETNPWFSPSSRRLRKVEGLFKGLPPTLIQVGAAEMTLDQVHTLRDRMKADLGDKLTYIEVPDGTHILMNLLHHEEEKRLTYREVGLWLKEIYG